MIDGKQREEFIHGSRPPLANGSPAEVCVFWNGSGAGLGTETGSSKTGNERCGALSGCTYTQLARAHKQRQLKEERVSLRLKWLIKCV